MCDRLDWEPSAADVIVGTSVGAVLAPLLAAGVPVRDLVTHQYEQPTDGRLANAYLDHDRILPPRLPPLSRVGSGKLLRRSLRHPLRRPPLAMLAALCPCGTSSFHPVRAFLGEVLEEGRWPEGVYTVTTNYDTGDRTVFSGRDGVDVLDAVSASCAVPGCFPPVAIGGQRFIDGSIASLTSADVLARFELDEVYVLAPMGAQSFDAPVSALTWLERKIRVLANRALQHEVNALRKVGSEVTVLAPCAQDLTAMGANMMDPSRRFHVLDTVRQTASAPLQA